MEKRQINAVERKTELCTRRKHFFGRPNCVRTTYTIDMYSSAVLGKEHAEYGKHSMLQSEQLSMEAAVESLYEDYTTDESLTAFTQLDYEGFYEES